ncbi:MAG: DnaJ domain-containing protein [Chloroflexota bacterium]
MAPDADPYRTLGLSRGATPEEVKAAYRRLAKANHPDAAGEAALPRFLAIQTAYEQLIGGFRLGRGRRTASAPRRPWEAERDGTDATRRAYGGRGRTAQPGTGAAPGPTGPAGSSSRQGAAGGPGSGPAPAGGSAASGEGRPRGRGRAGEPGATGSRPGRRRAYEPRPGGGTSDEPGRTSRSRPPNKATFGSTSYDGADSGPFEPDWGGASWYGTTSGTYWTLNPKEYADPRKHGPEYQARARRTARARTAGGPTGDAATGSSPEATGAAGPTTASWAGRPEPDASAGPDAEARPTRPTHTTSSWWDRTAGSTGYGGPDEEAVPAAGDRGPRTGQRARPTTAAPTASVADPPPPDLGRAAAEITRALTDDRFGGPRGRLARAAIGWLPIALGLSWLVGELTGCGRFAASCDGGAVEPLLLVAQVAVLAALLLVPVAASIAAMAALALLTAAAVASLILSATGTAADGDSRRAALGIVLLLAWLVGLAVAAARRLRTLSSPTSPVS